MEQRNITSAKYAAIDGENIFITATVDGVVMGVPLDPANTTYAEIMRQVEAGELVIQEAES